MSFNSTQFLDTSQTRNCSHAGWGTMHRRSMRGKEPQGYRLNLLDVSMALCVTLAVCSVIYMNWPKSGATPAVQEPAGDVLRKASPKSSMARQAGKAATPLALRLSQQSARCHCWRLRAAAVVPHAAHV